MVEILWQYVAEDRNGRVVQGQLMASSEAVVQAALESDELFPVKIKESRNQKTTDLLSWRHRQNLSLLDYAAFSRGLADVLVAGVSVADAIYLLSRRLKKKKLIRFMDDQLRRLRAGMSLSESLEQDQANVPRLMIALVAAGEASGTLDVQFGIIADSLERTVKLRRDLVGQLIYPFALLILIVLTLVFLSFLVLPQFEAIFANADAPPPPETQLTLAVGAWIRQNLVFLPSFLVIAVVILSIAKSRYHYELSKFALNIPVWGEWRKRFEVGRYCRSLGPLLAGGTSLSDALPIADKAILSPFLREQFVEVGKTIRAGGSLSASLEKQNLASSEVISLAEIGETTGDLGPMLVKAAQLCEEDIREVLTRVTTLAGPVLTAMIGVVTALVIASVMSGVLSLNDAIY